MNVLVGAISQLYQGDHDLGRVGAEILQDEDLGPDVLVEDFYYGAVAVAQRLQEVRPRRLILFGTREAGRPPGTVERRRLDGTETDPEIVQRSVEDAVVGYVDLGIALDVVAGLGALPPRTVVIEVEPARTEPSEELSDEARKALELVLQLVRLEIRRAPLFDLADRIRHELGERRVEHSDALAVLEELLSVISGCETTGVWGATFTLRDRLRFALAAGETSEGMTHLDWGLWWGLIEELDRLQSAEGASS